MPNLTHSDHSYSILPGLDFIPEFCFMFVSYTNCIFVSHTKPEESGEEK